MVTQLKGFDATEPEDIVQCCDLIAWAMWDSYQTLLQEWASNEDNLDDEDSDIFWNGRNSNIIMGDSEGEY